ncbi:hypothetical protein D9758_013705 [Tetrapyrgos nigripes]|uniref:Uncharacterized protein n=1 Tax=Tetrapyrgos nigripes TaxID=182062 RepID=A0A8H5CJP5_9AGAR|nr:hypothetical protein D9758_013705 [Tetrapyrgos nigripes]
MNALRCHYDSSNRHHLRVIAVGSSLKLQLVSVCISRTLLNTTVDFHLPAPPQYAFTTEFDWLDNLESSGSESVQSRCEAEIQAQQSNGSQALKKQRCAICLSSLKTVKGYEVWTSFL